MQSNPVDFNTYIVNVSQVDRTVVYTVQVPGERVTHKLICQEFFYDKFYGIRVVSFFVLDKVRCLRKTKN